MALAAIALIDGHALIAPAARSGSLSRCRSRRLWLGLLPLLCLKPVKRYLPCSEARFDGCSTAREKPSLGDWT